MSCKNVHVGYSSHEMENKQLSVGTTFHHKFSFLRNIKENMCQVKKHIFGPNPDGIDSGPPGWQ